MKFSLSIFIILIVKLTFAQLIQPFDSRFSTSQKGGIRILSNVSVSCNSGATCTSATSELPPNGSNSNGSFTMNYVDIDGNSSTFMSSSDSLNLANCSEILWAGLYWSGRATSSVNNWNIRNQVRIRIGNGIYQSLTADELVDAQSLGTHPSYHCFKDITSIVQTAGIKARFTVANVVTQTGGSNYWGGWSIIVVYKNVFQSMRNLTVFDGFGNISAGSFLDIPISGFATPPSGPVGFELGVIGFEGDRGSTGDQLQFNGAGTFVNVSDALHPTTDFFNSTISYGAAVTTFRNPNLNNTLGYDASVFLPNNSTFSFIGNNATSATIRVTTSSENILARAFTSAIDIYEPDLRADVRINDLNGGLVAPGDILEYTLIGKNIGSDVSINTYMVDTLDPRTTYVPNSISIVHGPNLGVKTDVANDDQAEYNSTNKTLKFRIGTGANNIFGGQVFASSSGSDSTVVKFRVQVINDCLMFQCDSTLSHVAYIYGTGNISGNSYDNGGASDTYNANGCPLEASNELIIDVSGCPPPSINYNSPVCVGENLVLTATFSASANYTWTGPAAMPTNGNSQTILNSTLLNSGLYNVLITFSGLNCSLNASTDVTIHPNPTINLDSLKNITCFNAANGKIYVSTTSGTPNYQYQWSPGGATSSSVNNLSPGTYQVTVTDANTCTDSESYTITQPTALLATASKTSNYNGRDISCIGANDGSANVTFSGGTAPYQISWSPDGQTTASISGLSPGTYTATITDANGCQKTSSVTLANPPALTSSHTQINVSCYGGSDGSINLTNGGGTPGYTYSWSNGQTTQDITSLSAGTYTVIISDLNGCTKNHSVTITQPSAPLTLTSTQVDVLCFGNSTGSIDISVSGGTAGYTYSWSNNSVSQDISNLVAGSYTLTTTDSKNCSTQMTITISQPAAPLSSNIIETDIDCFGASTGQVDLTVSGGTSPYFYSWDNAVQTQDLNSLLPGQYIVTITDNNGCLHKDTAQLVQPSAPLIAILSKSDATCFGSANGSLDATINGGTVPYTYLWSNGSVNEDISGLIAGVYSLQVTDNNGCQFLIDTVIEQPQDILLSSSEVDVLCFGEQTGSIDLQIAGGTAPFQFLWSNALSTEDISNVGAGIYGVIVTDANGCSKNYSTTVLEPLSPLSLTITHTDALCLGGQQGTTNLTASGGTAPYTFLWNNNQPIEDLTNLVTGYYYCTVTDDHGCFDTIGATILDPSNTMQPSISHTDVSCFAGADGTIDLSVSGGLQPYFYGWNNGIGSQDLSNLTTGNYFVTITDANSCQSFISAFVNQPEAPLSSVVSIQNVLCFGVASGSIDVTISGGTVPYSYSWNNGSITEDIQSVLAGSYTLTIRDFNDCELVLSNQITQPDDIVLDESHQNINCFGDASGTIDLSVAGGIVPYSFNWDNSQTTEDLSLIPAGSYEIIVTDNNQCKDSLTINLTEPDAPLSVSAILTDVRCFGESTGIIDLTVIGGTAPYFYNWGNGILSEDVNNLPFGTYQVEIEDSKGCTTSGTYTLTQPNQPLSTQMSMIEPLCFGDSNGSASVLVNGGTPGYEYLWQNLAVTSAISNIPQGMYVVEVTDANDCMILDSIFVTQPPKLIVNADSTWVSCWGYSDGGVQSIAQGGVGSYDYNWLPINVVTQNVSSLPAGIYGIEVTDDNNCVAFDSTEILQPDSLYAQIEITNVLCNGFTTGVIDVNPIGGTEPYFGICAGSAGFLVGLDWVNGGAGLYQYFLSDNNGCIHPYILEITQPDAVSVADQIIPVNCHAGADGSIDISVSGGVTPYAYVWSNNENTEDIDSLIAGTYTVQITDSNNCVNSFSFEVTQPLAPLTLAISQLNVACFGDSSGSINLTVSGGTPNYNYQWTSNQISEDISDLDTGYYKVYVTDAKNCLDSISTTITQPAEPISITETHVDILCFGASTGSIDIEVSGGTPSLLNGYQYDWSNSASIADLTSISAGEYQVFVTDSLQCVDSLSIILLQPDAPLDILFDITNVKCFGDTTGAITATISGGTVPYTYNWSTLDSTLSIDSLISGNYEFFVLDSNNCNYSEIALVSQPIAPLSAVYAEIQPQCFGYGDGQLLLTPSGGTPGYSYLWTTGDSTQNLDSLYTGNYAVTITDTNNCIFSLDCFLGEPPQLQPSFDADILVGCSPLVVNFTNTSDATFDCEWEFGDGGEFDDCENVNHTFESGGVFDVSLTVYDANGCFNDITYEDFITVYQTPNASINADPLVLYPEQATTTILNNSTDGDFYIWNLGVGQQNVLQFEPGQFTYPLNLADTFLISLFASTDEGCADTAYQIILFNNDPYCYVPNTFIPNNDLLNDIWHPVFSNPMNVKNYLLQVYNRWGELVFETKDIYSGWDGTIDNGKINVQDGTYVWKMQFTWIDFRVYNYKGHVNLLR